MTSTKKGDLYRIGDGIERLRQECPRCGPGVFLAEHKDRTSCGACGNTEPKSGK